MIFHCYSNIVCSGFGRATDPLPQAMTREDLAFEFAKLIGSLEGFLHIKLNLDWTKINHTLIKYKAALARQLATSMTSMEC